MLLKTYDQTDGDGEWYAPAFAGNRDKPPEERAEFYLLPLTKAEKTALERGVTTNGRSRDVLKVAEDRQQAKIRRVLEKRITGFRRVYRELDGKPVEITDSKEFLAILDQMSAGDAEELIDELIAALTDRSVLEEGILGNSESRSASGLPATATS